MWNSQIIQRLGIIGFNYPITFIKIIVQIVIGRCVAGIVRPCQNINSLERSIRRMAPGLLFSFSICYKEAWMYSNVETSTFTDSQTRVSDG